MNTASRFMMKGNKNRYSHLLGVEADVAGRTLITYIKNCISYAMAILEDNYVA